MLVVADIADSEQSASYYYGPSVFIPEAKKKKEEKEPTHTLTGRFGPFMPQSQNAMLPYTL